MKKSHLDYLRRVIAKAISDRNRGQLTDSILRLKSPDTGVHRMVRDIVCDARFYSVLDDDTFWKTYGSYNIGAFIDSIPQREWEEERSLTMLKEDFLNSWMASHMTPISRERRREIEAGIRMRMMSADGVGMPDPEEHDGSGLDVINLGDRVKDSTNQTGEPAQGLPPNLQDYMEDARAGNSPGLKNDGHNAEVRFMASTHPSIVRLARMIGRRGDSSKERQGKFRAAPKSDITGVTVGSDLSSLLPSEVALLATPEAEKVFLDRFARHRLQLFSSASKVSVEGKEKRGPIFICIDTSGSMTGAPEVMAKTLALAVSIVAQKEERRVCIFNYSFDVSFFVLKDLKTQRMRLLRFLSDSYGGGNDENRLIRFIFGRMPKMARYREVVDGMKGADMLVISDFNWIGLDPEQTDLLMKARRNGMRVFAVKVDCDGGESSYHSLPFFRYNTAGDVGEDEDDSGYMSGYRFLYGSDFRFRYDDGCIKGLRT